MKTFTINRAVERATGWQSFKCQAKDKEEAFKKFESGNDEFVDEEIEVSSLAEVDMDDIEEEVEKEVEDAT